jgi:DNA repair protein RecO (recombination protein O)
MLVKTNAIVLNSLKYGESQIIVDMFTEMYGRLSFMQRISRTSRSGVKKQFFQPLTILSIEFDFRPSQKLQRIKEAAAFS